MPVESVKVTQKKIEVTVKSTGQRLVVSSPRVQVVAAGKVGPSGPAGANADATFQWTTQVFELSGSQQTFELNDPPRSGSVFVYLNGIAERFWNISELTVTLDDIALEGDTVTISYQKET